MLAGGVDFVLGRGEGGSGLGLGIRCGVCWFLGGLGCWIGFRNGLRLFLFLYSHFIFL